MGHRLDGSALRALLVALALTAVGCGEEDSADPAVCGNSVREAGEDCDDGDDVVGDGCDPTCRFSCVGAGNCDDGEECTRDACETNAHGLACTHLPVGAVVCDDGNGCTSGDTCDGAVCVGTLTCECQSNADCAPLEDGDLCNGTLVCVVGTHTCELDPATVVTCAADGDTLCEKNRCDPATGTCGMAGESAATPCSDGSVCTTGDHCDGLGGCVTAGLLDCGDGADCTTDTCDSVNGCASTPSDAACDDANVCTVDACDPLAPAADGATGCTNVPLPAWYLDADGDGYGDPDTAICASIQPEGSYVNVGGDCCDASLLTHPGQATFYATANECGSFDYDCNGADERQSVQVGACTGGASCSGTSGFLGGPPLCGYPGTWLNSCYPSCSISGCSCNLSTATRTQACR